MGADLTDWAGKPLSWEPEAIDKWAALGRMKVPANWAERVHNRAERVHNRAGSNGTAAAYSLVQKVPEHRHLRKDSYSRGQTALEC